MDKFLLIQFKFDTRSLLKFGLLTLAVSFSLGAYTQANAQSAPQQEVEVISVPPQEAYYVEKTQAASPSNNTTSQNGKTLGHSTAWPRISNRSENLHSSKKTANSLTNPLNSSSNTKSYTKVLKPFSM
ncbi:hypothetical protein BZZ01_03365 [Nostocales cyanobacterium HT-58-2]|nr:hypothetical protein BZZ01_03365 [Nostocales cyanobacterium HT-58-2]